MNVEALKDEYRAELELDGVTVTVSGTDYKAMRGNQRRMMEKRQVDFIKAYRLSFGFHVDDTTPAVGSKITYNSTTYRVLDTDQDQDGVQHICHCGDEYA